MQSTLSQCYSSWCIPVNPLLLQVLYESPCLILLLFGIIQLFLDLLDLVLQVVGCRFLLVDAAHLQHTSAYFT